jgi:hypothetical protein
MRRFILSLFAMLVCACGAVPSTGGGGQPSANPAQSPVALTCTTAGVASADWPKPENAPDSGGIVSATASGDTLTLRFASGTPGFEVKPQANATFEHDASGLPVQLPGTAGVRIVLRGFRGDVSNYGGPNDLKTSGPLLLQASNIGDFEGVVSFAAGVSAPACANVASDQTTLTFKFIAKA